MGFAVFFFLFKGGNIRKEISHLQQRDIRMDLDKNTNRLKGRSRYTPLFV